MLLEDFHAGREVVVEVDGRPYGLTVRDLGTLRVPSGVLGACDPFVFLDTPLRFRVPPGEHPVTVTVADVSEAQDGSHQREAYLSLVLGPGEPASVVELTPEGREPAGPGRFYGVAVDTGTVAFVDAEAVARCMPDVSWYDELFEPEDGGGWFGAMDDPSHLRDGSANIVMPLASAGENVVLTHSGWGDGFYPVLGTYDADAHLVGVHIDLQVVSPVDDDTGEEPVSSDEPTEPSVRRGFWGRLFGRR